MMQVINTVVVTGGGTGGHLCVADALIDELSKQNIKVIFIGSKNGADRKWFLNNKLLYKKYFLDTRGVVNKNFSGKIFSLFKILKATIEVFLIYKKYKVSKVISVGGFSAAPASFATFFTKIDFYIHEQNSIMGKLNELTSKIAKIVFSSYDKSSPIRDYPVGNIFFQKQRIRTSIKTIIFLGGSQGAVAINNFALLVAPLLYKNNIKIIHQTGALDYHRLKNEYNKLSIQVDLFDFSTNIVEKMDKSDFAVSRSGASTLWELCALGLPALFIPYPHAAKNHQFFNAKFLYEQNLCYLKTQKELNIDSFKDILNTNMEQKSKRLMQTIKPKGAKQIIDMIVN